MTIWRGSAKRTESQNSKYMKIRKNDINNELQMELCAIDIGTGRGSA